MTTSACALRALVRACLVLALGGLLGLAPGAWGAERSGVTQHVAPIGLPGGALVIVGGGRLPDEVRDRFLQLAGGKSARLVIIPTASARADRPGLLRSLVYWKMQGVASVVVLHTHRLVEANDPAFVKPLTQATGVWLTGGNQHRLVEAYRGTLVERELQRLLARGGVIGGTSAGAAAMSPLMIQGGRLTASLGQGFGFLSGVIIDQHFWNRHRLDRLLGAMATHPTYVGLGIDEQTAAVVQGQTLTVLGNAAVRVCLPGLPGHPPRVDAVLKAGEHVDLTALSQALLSREEAAAAEERHAARADRPAMAP